MKDCLKIIKNYLDERKIENHWAVNEGNGADYISCMFPQFNNLMVSIESPFENEEVLIRSVINGNVTTKDLILAYSNINDSNLKYDFLKLVIQTQGDRKILIAMSMLPSLLCGLDAYFPIHFKNFITNLVVLRENLPRVAFTDYSEKITNENLNEKLIEAFKTSISTLNKDFLLTLFDHFDKNESEDNDNYNRVKEYTNILDEYTSADKSNTLRNLQYKVIFLTKLIDLSSNISNKSHADIGMQVFVINSSEILTKLFKDISEFLKNDIVKNNDGSYCSNSNSLELIFDPLYSSIKDNNFKFTQYFLENEIDEYWENILGLIDASEDEWVYDEIFNYDKKQLKDFAKDVNVKNWDKKSKNELIESILNTLSKSDLSDLCKEYDIVGFSNLGKLDIIKLITKNKNKFQ